jgi:hypothetical protein
MCLPSPAVSFNVSSTVATQGILTVGVLGSGPLQGVAVQLTRPDGIALSTTTDANGNASLPLGPPGLYTLKLIPNDGIHEEAVIQLQVNGSASVLVTLPKGYMSLDAVASPPDAGTVSPSGMNEYLPGTVVQVTATPAPGYSLLYWLLDGSNVGNANPITVTMNAPHQLVAVFSQGPSVFTESVSLQLQ